MIIEDLSSYEQNVEIADGLQLYIVVKSLNQIERRRRLIESKKRGKIGRIKLRPVSKGLFVKTVLQAGKIINLDSAIFHRYFREPRGLAKVSEDRYLLTEIGRVLLIDSNGNLIKECKHPYFAFLHSIEFEPENKTFLVVSAGYDCIFEFNYETGEVILGWFGWDHGFNPRQDGVYLTNDPKKRDKLIEEGHKAEYVNPEDYNEQGLVTSGRTTHPASACYNPYNESTIFAVLGHAGEVIEIHRDTKEHEVKIKDLSQMPHAILPHNGGWIVTNTLEGEFWILDIDFTLSHKIITANLGGKPAEMKEHEWLQAVFPIDNNRFIGIDGNRGLIVFDIKTKQYTVLKCDENWCIQHLLLP